MSEPLTLVKYHGCIEWHDGRDPAMEQYEYYLAADVDALMDDPQALAAYLIERKKGQP